MKCFPEVSLFAIGIEEQWWNIGISDGGKVEVPRLDERQNCPLICPIASPSLNPQWLGGFESAV